MFVQECWMSVRLLFFTFEFQEMDFSSANEEVEVRRLYKTMEEMADGDNRIMEIIGEGESPVHTTLKDHLAVWESEGATDFQQSVIREELGLKFSSYPDRYREPNNASFNEEQEFAIGAIRKLIDGHIIREVDSSFLHCINPLTVAHRKGKKRLCIDLSRNVNLLSTPKRFKIEFAR